MKIAIIGASGKSGRLIWEEAIKRGHSIVAFVRDPSKVVDLKAESIIAKNILDITFDDLKNVDVAVDAFGVWAPEELILHETSLKHLSDILSGKKTRLIVVGGAGSLYTDKSHKMQVFESPGFPDAFKPLAVHMANGLKALRERADVKWTYISPACDFQPDGIRTGSYKIGGEEVTVNSAGNSYISYADYSIAVVDEIEKSSYIQKRFTVVGESR